MRERQCFQHDGGAVNKPAVMGEVPILSRLRRKTELGLDSFGSSEKRTKVITCTAKSSFSVINIIPTVSYIPLESVLLRWGE